MDNNQLNAVARALAATGMDEKTIAVTLAKMLTELESDPANSDKGKATGDSGNGEKAKGPQYLARSGSVVIPLPKKSFTREEKHNNWLALHKRPELADLDKAAINQLAIVRNAKGQGLKTGSDSIITWLCGCRTGTNPCHYAVRQELEASKAANSEKATDKGKMGKILDLFGLSKEPQKIVDRGQAATESVTIDDLFPATDTATKDDPIDTATATLLNDLFGDSDPPVDKGSWLHYDPAYGTREEYNMAMSGKGYLQRSGHKWSPFIGGPYIDVVKAAIAAGATRATFE